MSQNSKIGKRYFSGTIAPKITSHSIQFQSQDISKWKQAINMAWSKHNPTRRYLIEMFDNLVIDGHTESVIEKRITAITNQKVKFMDKGNSGVENENIREFVTRTPWFYQLTEACMKAVPYGYSLIELDHKKGFVDKVIDLERGNVIPEWNWLHWDSFNPHNGIDYTTDKMYADNMLFVGNQKSFGKLFTAAQYIIYKRGGFADWAQFAELYGMPIREARYDPFDPESRTKIEEFFKNMGGNSFVVLPKGSELAIHDANTQGKSEIFKDMIEVCNSEISKLFLGNTLTTDAGEKGARSLGDVHHDVENQIALSDMIRLEYLFNWELKDKLIKIGYPLQNGNFSFDVTRELPLEKRILIDQVVAQQVTISDEYWYKTYGVEKGKSTKPQPNPKGDGGGPEKKHNSVSASVDALYATACTDCADTAVMVANYDEFDAVWERIVREIYNGGRPIVDAELIKLTSKILTDSVLQPFDVADAPTIEAGLVELLKKNVAVFSGFKTHQQLRDATDRLLDANGQIKPFSTFLAETKVINEAYNQNYLLAEYNHAIASGQMAHKWQTFESTGNLQYRTAKDERVREAHRILHDIVRPASDDFWLRHYPPNGWGCRCTVSQNDSAPVTEDSKVPGIEIPKMFQNNVGKTGIVFPDSHPYFTTPQRVQVMLELDKLTPKESK